MKLRKLHFSQPTYVGSAVCRSVDLTTHDIRIGGPGYIVTEKRSGVSFLVHAGACTGELDPSEEDDEPGDEKPARKGKAT